MPLSAPPANSHLANPIRKIDLRNMRAHYQLSRAVFCRQLGEHIHKLPGFKGTFRPIGQSTLQRWESEAEAQETVKWWVSAAADRMRHALQKQGFGRPPFVGEKRSVRDSATSQIYEEIWSGHEWQRAN